MSNDNKSTHILNASANLFGLCFIVFTSLKVLNLSASTIIDEFTAVSMFMFMISCATSFLSIRSSSPKGRIYESIADYVFMTGMGTLFLTILLIVLKVMV